MNRARIMIMVSAAILLALPSMGRAEYPNAGPYISGFIGASIPRDNSIATENFGSTSGSNDKLEFDPGINLGISGGYDFGLVRLEGEFSYKNSDIKSITDQADGYRFHSPDGSIGVAAFLCNAFFNLHTGTRVTPYLGGGIGFATVHLSDTYGTDTRGGSYSRPRLYDEGSDTVFAYQAGVGAELAFKRKLSMDIGYRYFATDTATINKDSSYMHSLKYESHNVNVGFRVRF